MSLVKVVSQVGLVHIGFNANAIGCDVDARVSCSESDWLQRRGRGQRAYPTPQGSRDYQQKIIAMARAELAAKRNPMLVMGCGAGKSYSVCEMAALAHAKGKEVAFITVRRALVLDLSQTLTRFNVPHSILMDGYDYAGKGSVVASIHTMVARGISLSTDLVVFDEAHLLLSPAFKAVVDRHNHKPRIFLTATPARADLQPMRLLADSMILGPSTQNLIERGFLVPTRLFTAATPDVSKLKMNDNDFNEAQAEALMNRPGLNGHAVKEWKRVGEDRPTVIHASGVAHSKALVEKFNKAGIKAIHLDSSHSDVERADAFAELQLNAPPKKDVILLDLAGNAYCRFGMPEDDREWSLDGNDAPSTRPRQNALSLRRCTDCFFSFRSYVDQCPECGKGYIPTQKKIIERDVQLQEIRLQKKKEAIAKQQGKMTFEKKLEKLQEIVAKGRAAGHKPYAAIMKYKFSTGEEVPREWYKHVFGN